MEELNLHWHPPDGEDGLPVNRRHQIRGHLQDVGIIGRAVNCRATWWLLVLLAESSAAEQP